MHDRLHQLLKALAQDLGVPVPALQVKAGILHASLLDGRLLLPAQHVAHWNRFRVIPTALVRDMAYACKREQLGRHGGVSRSSIEADAMAYAERFLRAANEEFED